MNRRFPPYGWLFAALILCCAGCAAFSNVRLRLQRSPESKDVAIQVDVIGIAEQEKDAWDGTNVNKYWSQVMDGKGDNRAKILQFSPGQNKDLTLKTSPKGLSYLVVISDYPSLPANRNLVGTNDPRLRIIPLDNQKHGLWAGRITVKIDNNGVHVQ